MADGHEVAWVLKRSKVEVKEFRKSVMVAWYLKLCESFRLAESKGCMEVVRGDTLAKEGLGEMKADATGLIVFR